MLLAVPIGEDASWEYQRALRTSPKATLVISSLNLTVHKLFQRARKQKSLNLILNNNLWGHICLESAFHFIYWIWCCVRVSLWVHGHHVCGFLIRQESSIFHWWHYGELGVDWHVYEKQNLLLQEQWVLLTTKSCGYSPTKIDFDKNDANIFKHVLLNIIVQSNIGNGWLIIHHFASGLTFLLRSHSETKVFMPGFFWMSLALTYHGRYVDSSSSWNIHFL